MKPLEQDIINTISDVLSENLAPIIYPAGVSLFHENEGPGHAYLIERGKVEISRQVEGVDQVVAILGPGELIGEMSPIDNQVRSATATALTETEVLPISAKQLNSVLETSDPLIQLLLRILIDRLRNSHGDLKREYGGFRMLDENLPDKSLEFIRGRAIKQIKTEKSLREALSRREFELHFQPIVQLSDYSIAGFESLIRWQSPEQGMVSPLDFIPVAEESGLIVPIGLWVLEHACFMLEQLQNKQHRKFPDKPPLFMTINVSAKQLYNPSNVENIVTTIKKTGVDPSCIKLEITEGVLLENPDIAIAAFNRLKSLSVAIALDDFGTGYSSLSYLHRFPLDVLKIDRSFVMSMLKSRDSLAIVRTITGLTRDLKLECVSEGIEQPQEVAMLKDFGCQLGQGYLFSKPLPIDNAMELLEKEKLWEAPDANQQQ